jgi:hypothetical protein
MPKLLENEVPAAIAAIVRRVKEGIVLARTAPESQRLNVHLPDAIEFQAEVIMTKSALERVETTVREGGISTTVEGEAVTTTVAGASTNTTIGTQVGVQRSVGGEIGNSFGTEASKDQQFGTDNSLGTETSEDGQMTSEESSSGEISSDHAGETSVTAELSLSRESSGDIGLTIDDRTYVSADSL